MKYSITVLGSPIPKSRPRFSNGHVYTPERTKNYEQEIGWTWRARYGDLVLKTPISMTIRFYFQEPKKKTLFVQKRPDIDNLQKSIMDGLNTIAYLDDKQIYEVHAIKLWGDPRVEVEINDGT